MLAIVPDDKSTPLARSNVPADLGAGGDGNVDGAGSDNGSASSANGSSSASTPGPNIALTARRLSFHLEALSSLLRRLSTHGAACAVRLHSPKCRTPDHLTLARRLSSTHGFVVTDEPFVDPYLGLVEKVEKVCRGVGVRCVRVDGSTTVPPCSVLRRVRRRDDDPSPILWEGLPAKAWMWQNRTESQRMAQIRAVMQEGAFEAPELKVKILRNRFFDAVEEEVGVNDDDSNGDADGDSIGKKDEKEGKCPSTDPTFQSALPPSWRNPHASSPGQRPWSMSDLTSIPNLKEFATQWPGADATVPPCSQTVGTHRAGMARWNSWVRDRNGLKKYGRKRNDMRQPHAPSRMSCYLNLGIVSVFRLVHEVKAAQARGVSGADKYEEEIVKWREMAYAFCFSRTDYCGVGAVPQWAQRSLEQQGTSPPFGWDSLALGRTGHDKWDAMQRYLVSTGELHNNVRMTWGKTVVGWSARMPCEEGSSVTASVLQVLCYLNDRYALDGLSPPSYAGLLWCLGWCDKPGKGGGISPKPASNYRYSPEDFRLAERALLAGPGGNSTGSSSGSTLSMKHSASQSSILDMMRKQQPKAKKQRTDDEGKEEGDCSAVNGEIVAGGAAGTKPSPGTNGAVKKKGSIASLFSPTS